MPLLSAPSNAKLRTSKDVQQESELKKGSDYEKYIETAFKQVSKKETIPPAQEVYVIETTDALRLQSNIARTNLKEIVAANQPSLINTIIDELKTADEGVGTTTGGDLTEFNKYFPTFKKSIANKIKSLDQFKKDWTQFTEQQIDQALSITPEVTFSTIGLNQLELEGLSNEDLDKAFRASLEKDTGKSIDNIDTFEYMTKKNIPSQPIKLLNKDGILSFKTPPQSGKGKTTMQKVNDIKIRYILKSNNPALVMSKIDTNWEGVQRTTGTGKEDRTSSSQQVTEGSGLNVRSLKKRLGHLRFP